ncbi:MAG: selenide, water dikinase SelD [Acidimicrobiia bacterium]|nr:selenide, water dikinase SelD [Acidimicrobiia bacterium]
MAQVLRPLHNSPATAHPDLVVGVGTSDDAGVYRIDASRSLIQTVDFFTPIVDEPYDWGRIAAANALSDVYAMGADPITALQLVGWPRDVLPFSLLTEVIEGGLSVMAEAGCTVVGGHSIDDQEPKYGFAVTGIAPTDEIITNARGRPNQSIVLTKPIGTGVIATAIKRGAVPDDIRTLAVDTMATLNRDAAAAARRVGVTTGTDVTGFGLLGHLSEVVRASGVSAEISAASVPLLDGAAEFAHAGYIAGGTRRNLEAVRAICDAGDSDEVTMLLLADAQTSGGLLLCVDEPLERALHAALADAGVHGWTIGRLIRKEFSDGPTGAIRIR